MDGMSEGSMRMIDKRPKFPAFLVTYSQTKMNVDYCYRQLLKLRFEITEVVLEPIRWWIRKGLYMLGFRVCTSVRVSRGSYTLEYQWIHFIELLPTYTKTVHNFLQDISYAPNTLNTFHYCQFCISWHPGRNKIKKNTTFQGHRVRPLSRVFLVQYIQNLESSSKILLFVYYTYYSNPTLPSIAYKLWCHKSN